MQNTHPIFIYAFPGMGKTTLCKQYGYVDYDCHEPSFPQPITHSIILTNDPTIESIAYILPQSFQDAVRKLPDYKQRYFSEINPSFLILTARNSPTSKVAGCKGFGLVQGLAPCA